jgi:lysylphosphatidylglycerol synthetase-like protein (DUF2156 family)
MPGLLTHLIASLIGFLALSFSFKNWKYGMAFVVGQLIPDIVRFGITGLVNGTLNFGEITTKPLFWTLSFTHYASTWVILFAGVFVLIFVLYKAKKIDKKKFKKWFTINLIFLIATIIHLILDALIIEKSYWI